jgi:ATP-dependent DNA ligase
LGQPREAVLEGWRGNGRGGEENSPARPFSERRDLLESLDLTGPSWTTSEAFDDGKALRTAVCEYGLEGAVAKKRSSRNCTARV